MSIKIRWGAPGSYKTSAAVADDFVDAVKAGRIVVTNVRGLNDKHKIIKAIESKYSGLALVKSFPFITTKPFKVPESFELHHLSTHEHDDAQDNREHLARWFHWLPKGSLLLLDEAQDIWPKRWTQKDIDKLDYPGGVAAASKDKRPSNFNQAFEMHRHHGWDIILTTPNITLIRPDVRATAEGAFRHDNQAMIGFSGWFMETFHMAINTGKSKNDALTIRPFRRIPKHVWGLYQSTTTGEVKDTIAGLSIFKNPRLLFLLSVLAVVLSYISHLGSPKVITLGDSSEASKAPVAPPSPGTAKPAVVPQAGVDAVAGGGAGVLGGVKVVPSAPLMPRPFAGYLITLSGSFSGSDGKRQYIYRLENQRYEMTLRESDFLEAGYGVTHYGQCNVSITYRNEFKQFVTCHKPKSRPVDSFASMPVSSVARDLTSPSAVSDVAEGVPH